jgi:hypothetical protein
MKNGAVVKPHPSRTYITDFSVIVGQSESELKQIDLNKLIELDADEQTPPKSWQELLDYYNRTHLVTNPKVAENLKRGEISNDYIQLQGEQDKRIKQTALRLQPLFCGCFNPNFHSKKCGLRKWN